MWIVLRSVVKQALLSSKRAAATSLWWRHTSLWLHLPPGTFHKAHRPTRTNYIHISIILLSRVYVCNMTVTYYLIPVPHQPLYFANLPGGPLLIWNFFVGGQCLNHEMYSCQNLEWLILRCGLDNMYTYKCIVHIRSYYRGLGTQRKSLCNNLM